MQSKFPPTGKRKPKAACTDEERRQRLEKLIVRQRRIVSDQAEDENDHTEYHGG